MCVVPKISAYMALRREANQAAKPFVDAGLKFRRNRIKTFNKGDVAVKLVNKENGQRVSILIGRRARSRAFAGGSAKNFPLAVLECISSLNGKTIFNGGVRWKVSENSSQVTEISRIYERTIRNSHK